ncbi:hypothetical protein PSTT_16647 [Puccinia striiformis]|uniref:Uncharacterized protein n=1 Tax=Puccinia striiformis TaxID=27350 RepID=A0A2S4UC95_9BASI|nr:hypothetical protein PSTT_16647 [Puccinia striiformis]
MHHGQYVSAATRQTHRMFEERNRIIVGLASARFYLDTINKAPAVLIVNLKTVLFYVTQQISLAASSYLLKLDRQLVEIVASQGLTPSMPPRTLSYSENIALDAYPKCTQTIIRHLAIDPDLNYLICCPKCFAMYPESSAPENCPTFPEELEPLIRQVKSLHNPIPFVAKTSNLKQVKVLDKYLFASLIIKINELFPLPDRKWIAADKWDKLKSKEVDQFAVVNSRITEISNVSIDGTDVMFSTFEKNANNSIIVLKPTVRAANYGIIKHIFKHSRIAPDKTSHTDTWFAIKPLVPVPNSDHPQPFEQLEIYEVGLRLRRLEFTGQKYIIVHSNEIWHIVPG